MAGPVTARTTRTGGFRRAAGHRGGHRHAQSAGRPDHAGRAGHPAPRHPRPGPAMTPSAATGAADARDRRQLKSGRAGVRRRSVIRQVVVGAGIHQASELLVQRGGVNVGLGIQPWPQASTLTSSGAGVRLSLWARTVPVSGAARSAVLADSMSPQASPAVTVALILGRVTSTRSPSYCCAKSVGPARTRLVPVSTRTHG